MATIKHLFHINAAKEKIFAAISTVEGFKNWWTVQTTGNSAVNGIIEFRFKEVGPDFKVVKSMPPFYFEMLCTSGFDDWVGTTVRLRLDDNEGKTRVRFEHDDWKEATDFYAACNFSWGRYMASLRDYCEKGKGQPFE
jgi:hypothetical protein